MTQFEGALASSKLKLGPGWDLQLALRWIVVESVDPRKREVKVVANRSSGRGRAFVRFDEWADSFLSLLLLFGVVLGDS